MQQIPARAYGITKVEYARMVREAEMANSYAEPREGFLSRLFKKKR